MTLICYFLNLTITVTILQEKMLSTEWIPRGVVQYSPSEAQVQRSGTAGLGDCPWCEEWSSPDGRGAMLDCCGPGCWRSGPSSTPLGQNPPNPPGTVCSPSSTWSPAAPVLDMLVSHRHPAPEAVCLQGLHQTGRKHGQVRPQIFRDWLWHQLT